MPSVRQYKYDQDVIIKAMEGSFGVVGNIVRRLGVSYDTFYDYVERFPRVKAALQAERESILDLAENVVISNLRLVSFGQRIFYDDEGKILKDKNGNEIVPSPADIRDARWVLSRLGKDRGYGENVGVNVKITGQDINKAIELELSRVTGNPELAALSTLAGLQREEQDYDIDGDAEKIEEEEEREENENEE